MKKNNFILFTLIFYLSIKFYWVIQNFLLFSEPFGKFYYTDGYAFIARILMLMQTILLSIIMLFFFFKLTNTCQNHRTKEHCEQGDGHQQI